MAHSGMLRVSCESNHIDIDIDMTVVVDPGRRCDVAHYRELIAFADALLDRDDTSLQHRRQRLQDVVGVAGVRRASAVVANFEMMNRALDTLGATFGDRLPSGVKAMAAQFGIDPPPHWAT